MYQFVLDFFTDNLFITSLKHVMTIHDSSTFASIHLLLFFAQFKI